MAISYEQFSALRAKGLSSEQIARFDSEAKSNTNIVKESAQNASKNIIRDTGRAIMGTGVSEFVPQLESPITTQASQTAMKAGRSIVNNLGIPSTPNAKLGPFNINPNSVSSNVIGGLLDPRSLLALGLGGANVGTTAGKALERGMLGMENESQLASRATKAMNEAEKITTQILQPTTSELSAAIASGKQLPSIARGAENISRAKSFDELVGHLRNTTAELFQERNAILKDNNVSVGTQAFDSLDELINTAKSDKIMAPGKLKILDNVYAREAEFLAENPNMDVLAAQARKEKLQDLTKPLLQKRSTGTITGAENVELQAYDALRAGYRKAILKALPSNKASIVDKINSKYEGLIDATDLASTQSAKSIKEIPQGIFEKIASSFGLSPQFTAFRLAAKEVAGVVGKTNLERSTMRIENLRAKQQLLNQIILAAKKAKK